MSNVVILAIAQMLAASGLTVVVLMGSIVGAELGPKPSWATVPISIAIVALALTTVPAAMLMRRIGRRAGFIIGALIGVCGGIVAAQGVLAANFWLFCGGTILLGASMAFTQQYRFAAAESVPPEQMSRAISYVLIGSLAAAVIGPQLALAGRWWLSGAEYAGSFAVVSVLYVIAAFVLSRLKLAAPVAAADHSDNSTVGELLARPDFRIAVFASVVAYAVMSFVMTAAPVSMHVMDHHSVEATTWVIQSHVLAMYLPSLVSGRIVTRFGERNVMLCGGVLLAMCAVASLFGRHIVHYWSGLVMVGVGWNLLFVSGTTLLARNFRGANRHRAQAINEFTVFGSQACASLLAGLAVQQAGWLMLNLATLPLLAAMFFAASRLRAEPARAAAAPAAAGGSGR
ncbi:MAG: MFS transporter [Steroidobacter sp.]